MTWTGTIPNFLVIEDLLAADLQTLGNALTALTEQWEPYVPSLTNITQGNGVLSASFIQVGKFVTYRFGFTFGSTSVFTGTISFGVPVTPLDANWAGAAFLFDSSTAANRQPAILNGTTTSTQIHSAGIGGGGSGVVNATSPFTWAVGDVIKGSATYEAA
jgi:hypothetical protein